MNDLHALIGRMLVVGIRGSDPDASEFRIDLEICLQANVGGIILFDHDLVTGGARNIESPAQVSELTSCLRESLGDELLIMIDQEGGSVVRLKADRGFHPGISAAEFALRDEQDQREIAQMQAQQLAGLGINVNLSPVVDLAISAKSQVITGLGRSFGVDPQRALDCARVWIEEHRSEGIITCLKHFPGHGSATGDTHTELVDISGRESREKEIEPYRTLSSEPGVMVMTGHLLDREIDPEFPASLSGAHTNGVLRKSLGFGGVVVTDSIDMGAIRSQWSAGKATELAIAAGADLVMDGVNGPGGHRENPAIEMSDAVASAIKSGRIIDGQNRLTASVRRIDRLISEVRAG